MFLQEYCFDAIPSMETFPDPLYTSTHDSQDNIVSFPKVTTSQGFITTAFSGFLITCSLEIIRKIVTGDDEKCGSGIWNELGSLFEPERQSPESCKNIADAFKETRELDMKTMSRRSKSEKKTNNSSKIQTLSRKTISQYFYTTIAKAAKELNVGVTLLKRRCRELGIRRWPHRKLMSIQNLIRNVQELDREGDPGSEGMWKEVKEVLEREKELIEEIPDSEMEYYTKRLRQACFKNNYKKRRLSEIMNNDDHQLLYSTPTGSCYSGDGHHGYGEMKSM
ncbi:RWP-RK domain-containing protein [Melia azedarach]|uniref:RWP-RK domain-containing protein n=1 Tax=Melia azedarach TaxID=155640 RepID=A0ACC1XQE9_MELAZ|nr:RWP-RK domain-containing protein [Melia azedarach]